MDNIFTQLFDKVKESKVFLFGFVLIVVCLSFLFWRSDLYIADSAGHLLAVHSARNFWPFLSGWDSSQLLGWPQGVFYPPLFHWLAAGLSVLLGVELAVRSLIVWAIGALPISLFFFSRSLTRESHKAFFLTGVLFAGLVILPNFLGTGLRSLFQIGLLSNFFALHLFFFFLASLHREKKNKFVLALLFSSLILSHIVVAIVSAFYLLIYFLVEFLLEKRANLSFYLVLTLLSAMLTIPFWYPFITNFSLTSVSRHVTSYLLPNVFAVLIAIGLTVRALQAKNKNILVFALFSLVFSIIAVLDSLLIRNYGASFFLYSAHVYRFQPFIYLFLSVAIFLVLFRSKMFQITYLFRTESAVLFVALLVGLLLVKNPVNSSHSSESYTNGEIKGRFLETFTRAQVDPFWYKIQAKILEKNPDSQWAYGLFTDSSPNGPFIGSLIKTLSGSNETEGKFIETRKVAKERLEDYLDLFGIAYLIRLENDKIRLEKIAETEIFSVVKIPLKKVSVNWEEEVEKWWFDRGILSFLPFTIENASDSENFPEGGLGEVEILKANSTKYSLRVVSEKNVPVLAKISYFPYWKAYKNGKEIPIYRAGPNLMLLYTNGEVTLEYKSKPF